MTIAVVGLGLIGGSLCKTIKKRTAYTCLGLDADSGTVEQAIACGAIDRAIIPQQLVEADMTIVCLHPRHTISFILENQQYFAKDSLVIDVCGVKAPVINAIREGLTRKDVTFLGTHPMAGREFSGFAYATDTLFDGASFIITPEPDSPNERVEQVKKLAEELGFGKVVCATAAAHDQTIAFTSQLAHVVSNAYVKSPSIEQESGFSAGSFLDLTRVAQLNEQMWASLFLLNQQPLLFEIDQIISALSAYRQAIAAGDEDKLVSLLHDGSERKKKNNALHQKENQK